MILFEKSEFDHFSSRPVPTAQGHGITEAGQALIAVNDGAGNLAAKAAAGAGGEKFIGISLMDGGVFTARPGITAITANGTSAQTFQIPNYTAGSASLYGPDGAQIPDTGNANIDVTVGGLVTVSAAAPAGNVYVVRYTQSATAADVQATMGYQNSINDLSAGAEVGLIRHALIFTSNYDTNVDWAIGGVPTLAAGGVFTIGGAGANATGCMVAALPRAGQPYLGIEISL